MRSDRRARTKDSAENMQRRQPPIIGEAYTHAIGTPPAECVVPNTRTSSTPPPIMKDATMNVEP